MRLREALRRIREYGLPLLLSLVLLEAGVRVTDPSGISDLADQRRLWKTFVRFDRSPVGKTMPPDSALSLSNWAIRTNRFGFRDGDFPEAKPSGESRILMLGDSYLFGHGVRQSALFPTLIEERLQGRGPGTWELVNTGLGSYATHEEMAIARLWSERLEVDAIVLLYSFNDADPRFVRVSPRHDPAVAVPESAVRSVRGSGDAGWKGRVRRHPGLYRAGLWLWPRTVDFATWLRKSRQQAISSVSPVQFDDSNWAWSLSRASLHEIQRISLSLQIPFVVLYLNDYGGAGPAPVAQANGEALRAFCEDQGIPYHDLRSELVERRLYEHRNSTVDGHPDAIGHEILADVLSGVLFETPGFLAPMIRALPADQDTGIRRH